jgi:signal transduction histidine kinase
LSRDEDIRQVGHDLRGPLNAIVAWGELLKAGQLSHEDSVRAGETIVRHARHMADRLNAALDAWRLDVTGAPD